MFTQFVEGVKLGALLIGQTGGIKLHYYDRWDSSDSESNDSNNSKPLITIGASGRPITLEDILEALSAIKKHAHHYLVSFDYNPGDSWVGIDWET